MGLVAQQQKAGGVAGREGGEQEQCAESNAQGAMHREHAQGWQKGTTCCPGCPTLCQILARAGSPGERRMDPSAGPGSMQEVPQPAADSHDWLITTRQWSKALPV